MKNGFNKIELTTLFILFTAINSVIINIHLKDIELSIGIIILVQILGVLTLLIYFNKNYKNNGKRKK